MRSKNNKLKIVRSGYTSMLALASALLVVNGRADDCEVSTSSDGEDKESLYIVEQPSDQFIHDRTNAVFTVGAA